MTSTKVESGCIIVVRSHRDSDLLRLAKISLLGFLFAFNDLRVYFDSGFALLLLEGTFF